MSKKEEVKEEKKEVKEEVVVVQEKSHKALTAVLFIIFTVVVLGVLSLILIPKLARKPVKAKTNNTYEINSEVKYSDLVDLGKNVTLDNADELVDTSKLGEKSIDVVYKKGNNKEVFTVKIKVVDTTEPVIECENKIEIYVGATVDVSELGTITDNSKEEIKPVITGDYKLDTEGEYKVTIKAKDSSGNEATKDIILVVKKVELRTEGYYVYKEPDQWDEFTFRKDGTGSYVPWFCPGSGCGGYEERGKYTIEGDKIILITTDAYGDGDETKVNNKFEFTYVSKDELKMDYKGKTLVFKWQKEFDK